MPLARARRDRRGSRAGRHTRPGCPHSAATTPPRTRWPRQPSRERLDQRRVTPRLVRRRERVDVGEPRQRDRHHLGGRVQLHRAATQRDHAAVQRHVPVFQPLEIAQHLMLGVVRWNTGCSGTALPRISAPETRRRAVQRAPNTSASRPSSARVTVSSSAIATPVASSRRRLNPAATAARHQRVGRRPASIAMVSKNSAWRTLQPSPPRHIGQQPRLQIDPPRDPLQPLRPVPDGVEARPSPPAAPAPCRCCSSPFRAGYAARASATPAASRDARPHPDSCPPAGPASRA